MVRTKTVLTPSRSSQTSASRALGTRPERAREALKKFRVVFSSVKKHFQHIESKCGVSGAQLWAIFEISRTPGLSVCELAQALSIHQSTASNLLGEIENRGFLLKERTGADQRVVRLHLTKKGKDVVARAPKPSIGVLPDALQHLPNEVLDSLNANMDVLLSLIHLKDEAAAAKPLSDI
jgi:DNA-binding MarR family transcriptional regulator